MPSESAGSLQVEAQAMRARLVRFMFPDEAEVDARTITVLNQKQIFKTERQVSFEDLEFNQIFSDAREQTFAPMGPLLVNLRVDDRDQKFGDIARISDLLLDSRAEHRALAFEYVRELAAQSLLTPRSVREIEIAEERITDVAASEWQSVAVSLADALDDDFLLSLAGLGQSLALRYDAGAALYVPRVLQPTLDSFESLRAPVWGPDDSADELTEVLKQCAAREELSGALNVYLETCGYVPFGAASAASAMVSAWMRSHSDEEGIWQTIWRWGKANSSPLAMYHVAEVAVTLQAQLKPDQAALQEVIRAVLLGAESEGDARWILRCQLATHYCRHFEVSVPNQIGDRIPLFAWWITEKVASVFGVDDGALRHWIRQFEPIVETTEFLWAVGVRTGSESPMRYATLFSPSLWADSLFSILWRSRAVIATLGESKLEFALGLRMMFAFPRPSESTATDFAFEEGLNRTAEAWQESYPDSRSPKRLGEAYQTYLKLANPQEIGDALPQFDEFDGITQLVLGNALNALAFLGHAPRDVMWEMFSSDEWRTRVFQGCRLEVLDALLQSARHLQFVGGEDWRTTAPHFFAQECIATHDDPDKRKALLLMTVISSIAADAVSAVQRILISEHRAELEEDIKFTRRALLAAHGDAPFWLRGRIRAVLSVL